MCRQVYRINITPRAIFISSITPKFLKNSSKYINLYLSAKATPCHQVQKNFPKYSSTSTKFLTHLFVELYRILAPLLVPDRRYITRIWVQLQIILSDSSTKTQGQHICQNMYSSTMQKHCRKEPPLSPPNMTYIPLDAPKLIRVSISISNHSTKYYSNQEYY